jgi:hypothetical protein
MVGDFAEIDEGLGDLGGNRGFGYLRDLKSPRFSIDLEQKARVVHHQQQSACLNRDLTGWKPRTKIQTFEILEFATICSNLNFPECEYH